eukprot:6215448-Amphidinium_carterae.4
MATDTRPSHFRIRKAMHSQVIQCHKSSLCQFTMLNAQLCIRKYDSIAESGVGELLLCLHGAAREHWRTEVTHALLMAMVLLALCKADGRILQWFNRHGVAPYVRSTIGWTVHHHLPRGFDGHCLSGLRHGWHLESHQFGGVVCVCDIIRSTTAHTYHAKCASSTLCGANTSRKRAHWYSLFPHSPTPQPAAS